MVNFESRYDYVYDKKGYEGDLWLQVTPLTFPVIAREGYSLNQLRIFCGDPKLSEIGKGVRKFEPGLLMLSKGTPAEDALEEGTLSLSIAPEAIGGNNVSAFVAKKKAYGDADALDLGLEEGAYSPEEYWEPVDTAGTDFMKAEPNRLYIVRSLERLCISGDVAVTCIAMTENLGDVRIHYAGFAHPWFGSTRGDDKPGTPLIFEVRCFTNQVLRHEEVFAEIKFYRMSKPVERSSPGAYGKQELKLSKIFKDWTANPEPTTPGRSD
jgi:dCTP deaminase